MTAVLDRSAPEVTPTPPPEATRRRRPLWWSKWALSGLLATTAVLYLWNLSASGFANTFYAAAAQAGSQSWRAWFFGSLDAANFITVDKPPASLWVTGLSMRIFGVNSWAALAPQALMGVAAVGLLYATMRRTFSDPKQGTAAGLIAGAVLAFTPAAALMFRFNNPDALLVLLMTAAGYCLVRAIATNSGRWLALVGVALGFAFLTKMMQGLLVLPAFGLAYLVFADNGWGKRILHLVGATVALIVSAGWFVVVTIVVPESSRPYIGGSSDNSFMDLVLGYNGLGRISGDAGNGPGGGGSFGGSTGLDRLFSSEMGNEISWLLPAALLVVVFAAYVGVRSVNQLGNVTGRMNRVEGGAVFAWGGWLLVTALVFSFMSGTIHPYYTVALAPAVGALVGIGAVLAWRRRDHWDGRLMMAGMIGLAAWWSIVLLNRNSWGPEWCRWAIGVVALASVAALLIGSTLGMRKLVAAALIAGSLAGFGGTAAFSIATAAESHGGSNPNAVSTSIGGGMGGGFGGPGAGGPGGAPGQGTNGQGTNGQGTNGQGTNGQGTDGRGQGGRGGPGEDISSNAELVALLKSAGTTWSAATNGSQSASGIELATGTSVMAIGGWSGDPAPTLDEFKAYVAEGKIGYYLGGTGGGPGGNSEISEWVAENFTATTVGGTTIYKLT
ncbi:phospholipid carrier-dependent glycosyltransferase [Gordonia pseudamarae]|jgi:4-amino-4-deoxy-L-arabinose transferase-like glycosyltransferase|uniref:Phospholipid carrier-dependent glycosyltransferase n=1 Tax=Gordonia pseudamarae TaxID=2831662 RepID=A0ABX6IF57_9ACTN|nr:MULTISPECIES: glycosyltransferase family 39 protein [Gordonia]MBD0022279.1 glycosyltransferase family 39 protein [Gordonia sp. (in: high G+C Gram-positive bacteria)]QHN24985.1 phospholipid carrier-dependent glycosyltransferase [Gordonia pseudamarae]QHN33920.1 phospholipid carrier-dependent glycosyltransferase [Gordonia pseudamarae]